eukprot:UN23418
MVDGNMIGDFYQLWLYGNGDAQIDYFNNPYLAKGDSSPFFNGAAGFGPSSNSPVDHTIYEFCWEIPEEMDFELEFYDPVYPYSFPEDPFCVDTAPQPEPVKYQVEIDGTMTVTQSGPPEPQYCVDYPGWQPSGGVPGNGSITCDYLVSAGACWDGEFQDHKWINSSDFSDNCYDAYGVGYCDLAWNSPGLACCACGKPKGNTCSGQIWTPNHEMQVEDMAVGTSTTHQCKWGSGSFDIMCNQDLSLSVENNSCQTCMDTPGWHPGDVGGYDFGWFTCEYYKAIGVCLDGDWLSLEFLGKPDESDAEKCGVWFGDEQCDRLWNNPGDNCCHCGKKLFKLRS